ncbi:hypothetical protein ACG6QP_001889 [Enterococcus hirae]
MGKEEQLKKDESKESTLKKCFFVTPIGPKDSEEYKKLEGVEKNVLKPLLEEYNYELIIAHKIHNLGSIGEQVFNEIIKADLIVSNLTGLNANVMYETAVAHSFGKPTIMICERTTQLPFDIISERTVFFDNTISGAGDLKNDLEQKIKVLQKDDKADNPVYRVLQRTQLVKEITKDNTQTLDKSIINMMLDMQASINNLQRNYNNHPAHPTINMYDEYIRKQNKVLHYSYPYKVATENGILTILFNNSLEDELKDLIADEAETLVNKYKRLPSMDELSKFTGIPIELLKIGINDITLI